MSAESAHRDGKAVFLDRDGTLIRNPHYGCDPARIELLDGVVEGLLALQRASFTLVIVTNQSGIARGYFSEQDLANLHRHLVEQLAQQSVRIAGIYYCPHHVEGIVAAYALACDCRKPRNGMLLAAAWDLGIDLHESWMVGDILDDVEAGKSAGCRSVLIDVGTEKAPTTKLRMPEYVAKDFRAAASFILRTMAQQRGVAFRGRSAVREPLKVRHVTPPRNRSTAVPRRG